MWNRHPRSGMGAQTAAKTTGRMQTSRHRWRRAGAMIWRIHCRVHRPAAPAAVPNLELAMTRPAQ